MNKWITFSDYHMTTFFIYLTWELTNDLLTITDLSVRFRHLSSVLVNYVILNVVSGVYNHSGS